MPMIRSRYPADWPAISRAVREAAGNRCQECGVPNGAVGARGRDGEWYDEPSIHSMKSDDGFETFGEFPRMVRIVLTVHHRDGDPSNNDPANLVALCQKHHLAADRGRHTCNAAATRRRRKTERGQLALIGEEATP